MRGAHVCEAVCAATGSFCGLISCPRYWGFGIPIRVVPIELCSCDPDTERGKWLFSVFMIFFFKSVGELCGGGILSPKLLITVVMSPDPTHLLVSAAVNRVDLDRCC